MDVLDQAKSYLRRGGSFCTEALRRIEVLPWWCIAQFAEALRLYWVAAVFRRALGRTYRKKGDCDEAIAEYGQSLRPCLSL